MEITVRETWYLKDQHLDQALEIFQEMDDILGPEAHEQEGWVDHAQFFQNQMKRERVEVLFKWKSKELHDNLLEKEKTILRDFEKKYFKIPRTFEFLNELPVEVD